MTNIYDAIKYDWIDELANEFFYEKCHGYPKDIIEELKKLITGTVEAQQLIESDKRILDTIPF